MKRTWRIELINNQNERSVIGYTDEQDLRKVKGELKDKYKGQGKMIEIYFKTGKFIQLGFWLE